MSNPKLGRAKLLVGIGALTMIASACLPVFDGNDIIVGPTLGVYAFVSWSAPTPTDGNIITSYQVEVDDAVIATISAAGSACVLTGLSPSTTYDVKVTAFDSAGQWSGDVGGLYSNLGYTSGQVTTGSIGKADTGPKNCVTPSDSDGDHLPDPVETGTDVFLGSSDTGTHPGDPDTDDDGINDGDEVLGTQDGLDLPAFGTNPLKQDILMEFDWFDDAIGCGAHTHRPSTVAVNRVVAAFDGSPVAQLDGSTGINMIIDYGQGGAFTGGNLIADADGVIAAGVGGGDYTAYKTANFAANRNGYFHWVLDPHQYNTTSTSSGQAEINGDDMIVSLVCYGTDTILANTIVHELGHNLSLHHGGNTDTNYKPNYNSVMNYRFQFGGVDDDCDVIPDAVLDYGHGTRIPLVESALLEADGVCGAGVHPLDWNFNSVIDATPVAVDTNSDLVQNTLTDFDDWSNLILTGINDGNGFSPFGPSTPELVTEDPIPVEYQVPIN